MHMNINHKGACLQSKFCCIAKQENTNALIVKHWQNVSDKDNLYFIIMSSSKNVYAFLLISGVDISHAYEIRDALLELKGGVGWHEVS